MKPFMGIDLTTNKKNEQVNGDEFLVAKPSAALTQALERSGENAEETIEKSKLSLPLRIIQWVCGLAGALIAISILRAIGDEDGVTLAEAYQNASWFFWLSGCCLVIWGVLTLIGKQKQKDVLESDEGEQVFDNFNNTCDTILADLDVPSGAEEIDILSFYYKVKGDNVKVCEKGMQIVPYITTIFHIYADVNNLYLTNLDGKYAFPLSSIQSIQTIKKTIRVDSWNKEEPYNKGFYKQYKLAEDDYGCIHCKWYHIVEIEHNGEIWGLYIPSYDLPLFEQVTGLKAEA